jgi:hypothetical protein
MVGTLSALFDETRRLTGAPGAPRARADHDDTFTEIAMMGDVSRAMIAHGLAKYFGRDMLGQNRKTMAAMIDADVATLRSQVNAIVVIPPARDMPNGTANGTGLST